jgi:hypothetical protein
MALAAEQTHPSHSLLEFSHNQQGSWEKMHLHCAYSAIFLSRFRHHVIDPMHVLWLGIARAVWFTWRALGIISDEHLILISHRLNSIRAPAGVASFSSKVLVNMAWMKSAEWQSWTLVYSLFVLFKVLPADHYAVWTDFVHGCSLLYQSSVTRDEVNEAERLFVKFYESFGKLASVSWTDLKPNFHFMLHLPLCVRRFGSVYNFHCYRFESQNQYLGNSPTNHKSVELQMLSRWYSRVTLRDTFANHMGGHFSERFSIPEDLLANLGSIHSSRTPSVVANCRLHHL